MSKAETIARVVAEHRGAYEVMSGGKEYLARVTGKRMFVASLREDYPAVGDFVAISNMDGDRAVIDNILPRRSVIKRKFGDKDKSGEKNEVQIIATNVDVALVVEAIGRDYNLNRFDRYFALARSGGVVPAIVINKIDLARSGELGNIKAEVNTRFPDTHVVMVSTVNDGGLEELINFLEKDKTYCFLGSSGVGKSSLINKLAHDDFIKTREISTYSNRGKHTTTGRQMYFLPRGAVVIDNPGIREVGMAGAGDGIEQILEESTVGAKHCRYSDCTHTHEPGCEILKAVESGELDEGKYRNYQNMKKEAEFSELSDIEKREKGRKFGRFKNSALKTLKNARMIE